MISIIVSSYQKEYYQDLKLNIKKTCGIDYEIIKIENDSKYSLCKAYNMGAEKAKYPYLVFIHEDVNILTDNWGERIINVLNDSNIGVVGLSGSNYYPNFPGSWWNSEKVISHIIQHHNTGKSTSYLRKNFSKNECKMPVRAVDGVFMACTKKVFSEFKFDEKITGYHCYDLVFTLKVSSKYQNVITDKILIEHFSNGSLNTDWIRNIIKVKHIIGNVSGQKINSDLEMRAIYGLILTMNRNKFNKLKGIKIIISHLSIKDIGVKNYFKALNRLRYL
ncbi:glycosyltransferase [Daejeonia sp. YH14]|uniref:glycosyltransferase n=1 Tax=Daejeonia sp. YH14 TaxID=3439042 RepID=UPI003F497BB5